jgi:hypothetical protein
LFFYHSPCSSNQDRLFIFGELRPGILTCFPRPSYLRSHSLVVHLRGGDIMSHPHRSYGQPPCQYYMDVIRQYRDTILLTDGGNPCELVVRAAGALRPPADVIDNFACMVYAHHLVLSWSTFGHAAMYVSPLRKRFWTFRNRQFGIFGSYQNCVPTANYMEIVTNWTASANQKHLMQTGSCRFEKIPAAV